MNVSNKYTNIQQCARSKFNWEFVESLMTAVHQHSPDVELFKLAEGIMWNDPEKVWVFHKDRVREFEETGDLKVEIQKHN